MERPLGHFSFTVREELERSLTFTIHTLISWGAERPCLKLGLLDSVRSRRGETPGGGSPGFPTLVLGRMRKINIVFQTGHWGGKSQAKGW